MAWHTWQLGASESGTHTGACSPTPGPAELAARDPDVTSNDDEEDEDEDPTKAAGFSAATSFWYALAASSMALNQSSLVSASGAITRNDFSGDFTSHCVSDTSATLRDPNPSCRFSLYDSVATPLAAPATDSNTEGLP